MGFTVRSVEVYAHSRNQQGSRHRLVDHLAEVGRLCEEFATVFGVPACGRLLGYWHDIGKLQQGFQDYLAASEQADDAGEKVKRRGPSHSPSGAVRTFQAVQPLAMVIAAHHEGFRSRTDFGERLRSDYSQRDETREVLDRCRALEPPNLTRTIEQTKRELKALGSDASSAEFVLRFLLSALVDADRLDTEAHFRPDRTELRAAKLALEGLEQKLREKLDRLTATAEKTVVNRVRAEVLAACLKAGEAEPGVFRLTAPTGGGKTLSSLAFALRHAIIHNLRRVVVAIPYTSIIDQTAQVYREILGAESILEHHSAVRESREATLDISEEEWEDLRTKLYLAAENWDVPLVVTTTNQLFESLFSNHPSHLRKIHNLARSVIIIDEVQTLPVELLQPTLEAIRQLTSRYGTTVVLCTATQPAVEGCRHLHGLENVHDILPDAPTYFDVLRRVEYMWPRKRQSWSEIAEEMRSYEQVLAVVNTRSDAVRLLDALDDNDALHLSAALCGVHRREVLTQIHDRLRAGKPCRLVSTQVVEAGVDIDFPVVMRAVGPLDRIVQAAGRCNREGKLDSGKVIVFEPEEGSQPPGTYRTATDQARSLLKEGKLDPNDPAIFQRYFGLLYGCIDTDRHGIEQLRRHFNYPEVAKEYRFIRDETVSVVVATWHPDEIESILARIRKCVAEGASPTREDFRALQPYMVNLYHRQYQACAEWVDDSLPGILIWQGPYHPVRGLVSTYTELENNLW